VTRGRVYVQDDAIDDFNSEPVILVVGNNLQSTGKVDMGTCGEHDAL
jgi:hypothetical protein